MREHLLANSVVSALYSPALEKAPLLTRLASSRYVSRVLGYLNYDNLLSSRATGMLKFLRESGIQLSEFVGNLSEYDTARKIFERQIRYWNCRPMPQNPRAVVCPADARGLIGSMEESSGLYLKQKFFSFPELLGDGSPWQRSFEGGDYAVFRLTPEKYHYTHSPVSGRVLDFYSVEGRYYPVQSQCGGAIDDASLEEPPRGYDSGNRLPQRLGRGPRGHDRSGRAHDRTDRTALQRASLRKSARRSKKECCCDAGAPKALFRPGQQHRGSAVSTRSHSLCPRPDREPAARRRAEPFLADLGEPLTETDVAVRSLLALPAEEDPC